MTDLPEYIYVPPKDEIKERLSLWYAFPRLGIRLTTEGKGICPFHDDKDPSLQIYANDRSEQRWHCFPCGLDGDVFDLIQQLYGCSFTDAVTQAASLLDEVPDSYVPPVLEVQKKSFEPADAAQRVNAARARAADADHHGILAARIGYADVSQPAICAAWDEYIRGTWGWGINELGEILMPHWSASGQLVGCKVRHPNGARTSIDGSDYTGQLYGAWLGRRNKDVLLTEGETDAVYAGWQAKEEGIGIDILSLPSGAGDDVNPEWIAFIKNARTIYIAFDPDEAGVRATWRWIKALNSAGVRGYKVCALPLGRDLRDARPTLSHLLAAARTGIDQPSTISAGPGGYGRQTKEGDVIRITNWTAEPTARLVGGEDGYDVRLDYRGTSRHAILRLSDLATARELKRWCNRHGLIFTGRDDDVQRIAEYIEWRGSVVPEVMQSDQIGMHSPPDEYRFAGPSVVLPDSYIGKMPWRYVPTARSTDVTGKTWLPTDGPFRWQWLEDFIALSSPTVTHPLLAWAVATARRSEAQQFPLMFIGGSSGVGKSTLAKLACRLVGSRIEIDLGNVTPFILVRTLASSRSLPVFIDEWTRISRKDSREAFQGSIPILYVGGNAERGQADLSAAIYQLTAPVVVAGEDVFMLDREIERMIAVNPSRSSQNHDALERVIDKPIERFGQLLHTWLMSEPDLPSMRVSAVTRIDHNKQILNVGWTTLKELLAEAGRYEDVPDLPDSPDLSAIDDIADREDENVYDQALLIGAAMTDNDRHPVVWADPDGRGTWVRPQVLTGLIQSRNVDLALPGGSRAMKAYFEERYGAMDLGAAVTPPNHFVSLRAWLIPGHVLPGSEVSDDPRMSWHPS